MAKESSTSSSHAGCWSGGCISNVILGWWAVQSCAYWLFDYSISFWMAFFAGLFVGQFAFPVALLLLILRWFGVSMTPGMLA